MACRGFEPTDRLITTVLLEGDPEPLDEATVRELLSCEAADVDHATVAKQPLSIDEDALADAIDDAVLDEQFAVSELEEARFRKKIETLDRYLDDQVLVLRRQQATLSRKLDEEVLRRERASSPGVHEKANRAIDSLNRQIAEFEEKIERLRKAKILTISSGASDSSTEGFSNPTSHASSKPLLRFRLQEAQHAETPAHGRLACWQTIRPV